MKIILSVPVRIALVAVLATLALTGMVVGENRARASGREVIMTMQAVDPRDALTGHYVEINISERVAPGGFCPQERTEESWLTLAPANGRWHAVAQARTRALAERPGHIVARGSVSCMGSWRNEDTSLLMTDLGVRRFHIHQSEAERIEKVLRDRRDDETAAAAILSVGADGKARLKGVLIDDRRMMLDLY